MNWNVICMNRNEVWIRLKEKKKTYKKIKSLGMSQKWKAPCTCWSHWGPRLVGLLWAGAACELAPQGSAPRPTLNSVRRRSCSSEWLSAGGAPSGFPGQDMFCVGEKCIIVIFLFKIKITQRYWDDAINKFKVKTYFSSTGGITSSGLIKARFCSAWAASRLPVLLNMASRTGCIMLFTNSVISSSVSLWLSGIGVSQEGFR